AHAGHDHGTPVLVNPYADRELQGRLAIGCTRGRGTREGFGPAQHDLTRPDAGPKTYDRLGASYARSVVRFTSLQLIVDAPVTAARRNEREIGLTLKTGF